MLDLPSAFLRSVQYIAKHGDTDVFPPPIEKYFFFDRAVQVAERLMDEYRTLAGKGARERQLYVAAQLTQDSIISPAGYNGFRLVSQLDQFWNAFLLGLIIAIGNELESSRLPATRNLVFSYRYAWDDASLSLFDRSIGWRQFNEESIRRARLEGIGYVLSCDIADFYPRVYHHSLENNLARASPDGQVAALIMSVITAWSKGVSYGLPVGGDSARVLSELVLDSIDRRLVFERISFCRFVDDYRIFARTQSEAHAMWVTFSDKLLRLEGLQLQKSKTTIEPSTEFV